MGKVLDELAAELGLGPSMPNFPTSEAAVREMLHRAKQIYEGDLDSSDFRYFNALSILLEFMVEHEMWRK